MIYLLLILWSFGAVCATLTTVDIMNKLGDTFIAFDWWAIPGNAIIMLVCWPGKLWWDIRVYRRHGLHIDNKVNPYEDT